MKRGRVRVGCSGWQYAHWRGRFYPERLSTERWLEHYATVFDTVEVNNSFYRLPERATVERWAARVPDAFVFAVKASRFLTHVKRLKEPEEPLKRLCDRLDAFGAHLGPVLYQLPTGWHRNDARFEAFVRALPDLRQAVEFREPSWYAPEVLRTLQTHGLVLCVHDMPGSVSPRLRTGPFLYVRFHGAQRKYQSGYSRRALAPWIEWISSCAAVGCDVYAYFNNDANAQAPRDAIRLREALQ